MIKLIQIREGFYINEDEIKSIYVSDKQLTIYKNDGEDCVIKAGEGYYKTARKALGV